MPLSTAAAALSPLYRIDMFLGNPSLFFLRTLGGVAGCGLMVLVGPSLRAAPVVEPQPLAVLTETDHQLLEEIERMSFRFFVEQANPHTGLVRDRARADGSASEGKASIGASGFSFNAWVIATERGWVERPAALERIRHKLRFLVNEAPRRHGFFYHFMEMDTGARAWKCEVSSIDTALLLAGAIVAREYFGDPEITSLVNHLLADVDWSWFRNGGQLVSLSWHDETGFSRYRWNRFSEHLLMSFLALGASPQPVDAEYWRSWDRRPVGRFGDRVFLQEPPLFVHQFPQAFIDLRDRRDAYVDYFRNSQLATLAQRQMCIELHEEFPSWGENLWGVTASDSATGYKAWGGPSRTLRYNALDGTIVPCATAGSLPFAPRETLQVLHYLRLAYGDRLWKRYGFVDAFNPETGWVNPDVIGIDQGISLVQAENLRTGLIQRLFMQSPEAQLSLTKAGLLSKSRDLTLPQEKQVRDQAVAAWQSLQSAPADAGLQLTALLAAHQLGLFNSAELLTRVRPLLATVPSWADAAAVAHYAAALITVRQALPELYADATRQLGKITWPILPASPVLLGSASRLELFLQVALKGQSAGVWTAMSRASQAEGAVQVLSPAQPAALLLPGLWLDESTIITGAAAGNLAYAQLTVAGSARPTDAMTLALQLDHFPKEVLVKMGGAGIAGALLSGAPEAQAALLITSANLLVGDCIRHWFQQDPLVRTGRGAIAEFGAAAFGPNSSIYAKNELALSRVTHPLRSATAVAATLPREQWNWHLMTAPEFRESDADVMPGDAPLEMRFAFTWDSAALYFHAEVTDSPAGYTFPPGRNRMIELFIDPRNDGLIWTSPLDRMFTYKLADQPRELFNHAQTQAGVIETEHGYNVEASIPWSALSLTAKSGLELSVSPAVLSEGSKEWEAMVRLNWSAHKEPDGQTKLGVLRLE